MTENQNDKREMILDAAEQRFARYGFSKVTMDEIAQDIGMGKASLYYYFPTKESISKAVFGREAERFLQGMQDMLHEHLTAAAKLSRYPEKRLAFFKELVIFNSVNIQSWLQLKPAFEEELRNFTARELQIIRAILEEGVAAGEFQIPDTGAIATVFLHSISGLRLYHMKHFDGTTVKEDIYQQLKTEMDIWVNIFIKGISR